MDLLPTEQQGALINWAKTLVLEVAPLTQSRTRINDASRIGRDSWRAAAQAGLFAARPFVEQLILAAELGRALAPMPYLATLMTAALAGAETVLAGDAIVALAEAEGEHLRLYEADGADLLLVVNAHGARLFEASAVHDRKTLDPFDPLTSITIARLNDATPVLEIHTDTALVQARLLVAAQATAIAEATRDLSAERALQRIQFGKPIGTFQAVKHRCADMAVRAESALALTRLAAAMVSDSQPGAALQATAAKAIATRAALANARDNIQNFGGYGTIDMLDHHLYMKRCHVLDVLFGNYRTQLAELIEQPLVWDAA
jgi:hypothetical protein